MTTEKIDSRKITTRDVLDARDAVHTTQREWDVARDRLNSESRLLSMCVDDLVLEERLNVHAIDVSLARYRVARDAERDCHAAHMQARGRHTRLEKAYSAQQMTMDEIVRRAVGDDE